MSYVYLWYAENYLRYTLSSDSFITRVIFTRMGSENGSFPSTDPMDSHNCSIFYPIEHGYELVLPWVNGK